MAKAAIPCLLWTASAALTLAAVYAGASAPAPPSLTAKQLVQRFDGQIQARFQNTDAGTFGPDRFTGPRIVGHMSVVDEPMSGETARERRALKPVTDAPYFSIVGILHVRHKPGTARDPGMASLARYDHVPSAETLEVSGTSDKRAMRTFAWAETHIEPATLWAAKRVRDGHNVDSTYGKFYVAIRPIKALHQSCVSCHAGTHKGDTLGAMIYMVAPTPNHARTTTFARSDSPSDGAP